MSVKVFPDNTVPMEEDCVSVFNRVLVQVPESIAYITCITSQVYLLFLLHITKESLLPANSGS